MRYVRSIPRVGLARGTDRELALVGTLLVIALLASLAWPRVFTWLVTGLLLALFALLLYFFRDPERHSPVGDGLFLAPADGKVMAVQREHEARFLEGEAVRISIFMSLTDVHVNRMPIDGRVELVEHVAGRFLQAFRPESSDVNEHNLIGLNTRYGRVLVKQVSGIMARRIVCWAQPGQELEAGDRLGLIKFGSRVDLHLPAGAEPAVEVGDRTLAGVTVLARWKE